MCSHNFLLVTYSIINFLFLVNLVFKIYNLQSLTIKGVDGLYRHGSRYPSVSLNKAMKNVLHLADLQNVNFKIKESIKVCFYFKYNALSFLI